MPLTASREMLDLAARAVRVIDRDAVHDITGFVCGKVGPDGGFRGRSEPSDLYYSVFGAFCLRALSSPLPPDFSGYLEKHKSAEELDFIHLACLARCLASAGEFRPSHRTGLVLKRMETYRAKDGGYHHALPESAHGTAYGAFLALLAHQDSGTLPPNPERLRASLAGLKTCGGGYANAPGLDKGSTTATAAAIILLNHLGARADDAARDWLLGQMHESGGFLATASAPLPDLLCTGAALFALWTMHTPLEDIRGKTVDFIERLWHDDGGFCGHFADSVPDCEYTFYALLSLGCLEQ